MTNQGCLNALHGVESRKTRRTRRVSSLPTERGSGHKLTLARQFIRVYNNCRLFEESRTRSTAQDSALAKIKSCSSAMSPVQLRNELPEGRP